MPRHVNAWRMIRFALASVIALWAQAAAACTTALLLMIDVSSSIDAAEYRVQTDGLADALNDPEIRQQLIAGDIALSVMQWSGADRQLVTQDWQQMRSALDIEAFAEGARTTPRAFVMSGTAPGDALAAGIAHLQTAPTCARRIIDVSGDGTPNDGIDVPTQMRLAERQGITINGIAIESLGLAITGYYRRHLITRDGFVITARGHREYPEAIRRKILREITLIMG